MNTNATGPGPAMPGDRIHLVDEVAKKASQLHALLLALQPSDVTEIDGRTMTNGLWLATDLAASIFEPAVGFPITEGGAKARCKCGGHHAAH